LPKLALLSTHAPALAADAKSEGGQAQGCFGPGFIAQLVFIAKGLFSTGTSLLGSGDVYLFGVLGGVGEDGDFTGEDLHEASGNDDALLVGAFFDAKLTDLQDGDEGCVMRQDSDFAVYSGCYYHVYVIIEKNLPLGGHDFQCQWHLLSSRPAHYNKVGRS
jgi:hypothetical protein